jgi:Protein of unknown function (DUF4054)
MGGQVPNIDFQILSAWGFADECEGLYVTGASGLVFGTNPPYQISDFLALYPKFGTLAQSIAAYTLSGTTAGYAVNDTLTPAQSDSSGAVIVVTATGVGGTITGTTLAAGGAGYSVATGLATTTSGAGTGALVNITALAPGNLLLPYAVLQMYVNLASACLVQARWLSMWPMAMGLFVAHYCTLYLLSDGTPANSAGQAAQQGLARGIAVSKAAGDVSVTYETVTKDMEQFGAWNRTEYGQQLATLGAVVGMGPLLLW